MKTFLFYDIETSGLSSSFDQILTFAAIRTDLGFAEISRESVVVKLRCDIVPSPGAFITHRLTYEELSSGLVEYDAARKIHRIMNTPGTVSIGYNTLGFDDEFLRFTFYRNLLDPYSHQYANGCSRMDLLPIATLFRIFKPQIIKWPQVNGKSSLKLELISEKNAFVTSGRAHDAMADVESTLALARVLMTEKEMWSYSLGFFDKRTDRARMERIEKQIHTKYEDFRLAIMVSLFFGADNMYMAPVLHIGSSNKYSNQSLWLRLDVEEFLPDGFDPGKGNPFVYKKLRSNACNDRLSNFAVADENDHAPAMPVIRKKSAESQLILPPVERFWNRLSKEQHRLCKKNLESISSRPEIFHEIVLYHRSYEYPFVPDLDADASLYQAGFFSKQEKNDITLFCDRSNKDKIALLKRISSPRIKSLATRIVFRNYPDMISLLPGDEYEKYMEQVRNSGAKDRIKGYKNDFKLLPGGAQEEIVKIKKEQDLDPEQVGILEWLNSYIKKI
ncbi:MAG: exonuclease domain-containing protein [Thermodesulfobacteriota bacterium]|nr:exonuclease domain-containing protein [Thermodesulfobacteriota bacterium]